MAVALSGRLTIIYNIPVTVNLVYSRTALFLSAFLVIYNSVIVKVSAASNHSDLKNIVP